MVAKFGEKFGPNHCHPARCERLVEIQEHWARTQERKALIRERGEKSSRKSTIKCFSLNKAATAGGTENRQKFGRRERMANMSLTQINTVDEAVGRW